MCCTQYARLHGGCSVHNGPASHMPSVPHTARLDAVLQSTATAAPSGYCFACQPQSSPERRNTGHTRIRECTLDWPLRACERVCSNRRPAGVRHPVSRILRRWIRSYQNYSHTTETVPSSLACPALEGTIAFSNIDPHLTFTFYPWLPHAPLW